MKLRSAIVVACLAVCCSTALSQDIATALMKYEAAVKTSRLKFIGAYRNLIQKENEAGNANQANAHRRYMELFENESALYLVPELEGSMKEYGSEMKAASDELRSAYLDEIKRLNAAQDFAGADNVTFEMESHRLFSDIVSFQPYRERTYLIHGDFLLNAGQSDNPVKRFHASWEIVGGLSAPEYVSIRPINWPTHYIDHFGFRVRVQPMKDDESWKKHASWIREPGLASREFGVSFRSVSHPDRYIRVRDNGEVWLEPADGSAKFRNQATFHARGGLYKLW